MLHTINVTENMCVQSLINRLILPTLNSDNIFFYEDHLPLSHPIFLFRFSQMVVEILGSCRLSNERQILHDPYSQHTVFAVAKVLVREEMDAV